MHPHSEMGESEADADASSYAGSVFSDGVHHTGSGHYHYFVVSPTYTCLCMQKRNILSLLLTNLCFIKVHCVMHLTCTSLSNSGAQNCLQILGFQDQHVCGMKCG